MVDDKNAQEATDEAQKETPQDTTLEVQDANTTTEEEGVGNG